MYSFIIQVLRINELLMLFTKNKLNILELFNRGNLNVYCKKTNEYCTVFLKSSLKQKCIEHLGPWSLVLGPCSAQQPGG